MTHIITAKNTTVTDSIRAYIEKRFVKFSKYMPDDTTVYTKIEVKDNGNRHKVEVTIPFGKQTIRAEVSDTDMYVAIDSVEKTVARLLRKRKEKIVERRQQPGEAPAAVEELIPEYNITRVKLHKLASMGAQEACEAMEMIGHPFYAYMDEDRDNMICIVYLRNDGTCGQIVCE